VSSQCAKRGAFRISQTPETRYDRALSKTLGTRKKTPSKNRKAARRVLLAGTVAHTERALTIPTRWLKNFSALFLLAPAWVLSQAFFTCFTKAAAQHAFWATEEFWFFALGAVFWVFAFFGAIWVWGEPRPIRLYVWAHELTHALWARAMGGTIFRFRARRDGGYVVTDKANFWIALAPYFHPFYAMLVLLAYGTASWFYDLRPFAPALYFALGLTWSYHLCFTLWMIPKGQTDLTAHGMFFSIVVIYTLNLLILSALLIFAAPEVSLGSFAGELVRHGGELADFVLALFHAAVRHFAGRL
jgi:hypothetical protein